MYHVTTVFYWIYIYIYIYIYIFWWYMKQQVFGHVYYGSMVVFFQANRSVHYILWQVNMVYQRTAVLPPDDSTVECDTRVLLAGIGSLFGCFGEGVRSYGQGQRWGFVSLATLPQSNISFVDFVTWSCRAGKRNLCAFMAEPYLHLVIVVFPCCFAYRKSCSVFLYTPFSGLIFKCLFVKVR